MELPWGCGEIFKLGLFEVTVASWWMAGGWFWLSRSTGMGSNCKSQCGAEEMAWRLGCQLFLQTEAHV